MKRITTLEWERRRSKPFCAAGEYTLLVVGPSGARSTQLRAHAVGSGVVELAFAMQICNNDGKSTKGTTKRQLPTGPKRCELACRGWLLSCVRGEGMAGKQW